MKICREDHDVRSDEARRSPALAWSDEMKARIQALHWNVDYGFTTFTM